MASLRQVGLLLLAVAGLGGGCGKEQPAVDRKGSNAVAKVLFEDSSWYVGHTVIDVDYVVLESNRFRTPYVAVKVRPSLELNLKEE